MNSRDPSNSRNCNMNGAVAQDVRNQLALMARNLGCTTQIHADVPFFTAQKGSPLQEIQISILCSDSTTFLHITGSEIQPSMIQWGRMDDTTMTAGVTEIYKMFSQLGHTKCDVKSPWDRSKIFADIERKMRSLDLQFEIIRENYLLLKFIPNTKCFYNTFRVVGESKGWGVVIRFLVQNHENGMQEFHWTLRTGDTEGYEQFLYCAFQWIDSLNAQYKAVLSGRSLIARHGNGRFTLSADPVSIDDNSKMYTLYIDGTEVGSATITHGGVININSTCGHANIYTKLQEQFANIAKHFDAKRADLARKKDVQCDCVSKKTSYNDYLK